MEVDSSNSSFALPPSPNRRAARQDWYRTAGITLAWLSLLGAALGVIASLLLLSEWVSRLGFTLASFALAVHVGISLATSRTPRLEA